MPKNNEFAHDRANELLYWAPNASDASNANNRENNAAVPPSPDALQNPDGSHDLLPALLLATWSL